MDADFEAAVTLPHRMQPGLRRLAAAAPQLTPTRQGPGGSGRHLLEKLAVLGRFADQAQLQLPGFDAGPALQRLARQAAAEHPQAFCAQADGGWCAPALGWRLAADGTVMRAVAGGEPAAGGGAPAAGGGAPAAGGGAPAAGGGRPAAVDRWPEVGQLLAQRPLGWRLATLLALALAEDFAVLDGRSGGVPWLAVALPSMWAPEEKLGQHFSAIHAPVADNHLILQSAQALLHLLTGPAAQRWERFVWTITGHPRLHAHPQRVDPQRWPRGLDDAALAAQAWWRTERQTFLPVPETQNTPPQAVFTIRVDVQPLASAITRPAQAARVHAALASMSPAVLVYRGLAEVQPALLRWLGQRAAGDLPSTPP